MIDKDFEPSDDYKEVKAQLHKIIKSRDEIAESLKSAPPDKLREGYESLAQWDKKIKEIEAFLKTQYEAELNDLRVEAELEEMKKDLADSAEKMFIYVKHRQPDKLNEIKSTILKDYTPEEEEAFYDRVAIREATQLEEIIAENKKQ